MRAILAASPAPVEECVQRGLLAPNTTIFTAVVLTRAATWAASAPTPEATVQRIPYCSRRYTDWQLSLCIARSCSDRSA